MLTKKQVAVLLFFCLFAYFPAFLTPTVGGWDSYYYLNALKVPENAFLWVKVTVFFALFASTYFVALLGQAFNAKHGWKAGIFCFAAIPWLMDFWKFETEQFAYPFLFAALYFFFTDRKKTALLLLAPAFLLWRGAALYLFPFTLYWAPLLIVSIPAAAYVLLAQRTTLWFNLKLNENFPVFGVAYQLLLLVGLGWMPKKLFKAAMFFLTLAFINAKYAIHLTPFLAVGMACLYSTTKHETLRALPWIAVACGLMVLLLPVAPHFWVANFPPTGQDFEAARVAVQEAKGEVVYNDWETGHLVEYLGGSPWAKEGGVWPDINCSDCVVLTKKEGGCTCLNCPSQYKVYRC